MAREKMTEERHGPTNPIIVRLSEEGAEALLGREAQWKQLCEVRILAEALFAATTPLEQAERLLSLRDAVNAIPNAWDLEHPIAGVGIQVLLPPGKYYSK